MAILNNVYSKFFNIPTSIALWEVFAAQSSNIVN